MRHSIFFLILLICNTHSAQSDLSDSLIINIEERLKQGHSPSYAIGIIDKEGPRYYSFGNKSIDGEHVDENTIYEIGSISKTFTAILLAKSVMDKRMALDHPVQDYLPEGVRIGSRGDSVITLGHLSDHTSSLPRMPSNFAPEDPQNPFADYTYEQLYDFLNNYELPRAIGSAYEYSNVAQGLLGHILELDQGKSYEELIIEQICDPLGMGDTRITLNNKMADHLAIGHNYGIEVPNWDIPTLAGAGAIRSSVKDMLVFLAANMGLIETDLLPVLMLTHEKRHNKAGRTGVGLGWHITPGNEGDVIWHNGGTGGYRTFAGFVKETGKGVVVLTNSTTGADDIGFHLLNSGSKLLEITRKKRSIFRKKK